MLLLAGCSGGSGGNSDPAVKAEADSYTVGQGKVLSVSGPGVLVNDTPTGTLTASLVSGPVHGSLTLNSNGSFNYTHDGGGGLPDSFTYRATNGSGSATATVSITISPPIAVNDAYVVKGPGQTLSIPPDGASVLANDSGSGLTAVLVSPPAHAVPGTFGLSSTGTFVYQHDGTGSTDFFTYYASSGGNTSAVATVTLAINQPPVATGACQSTARGVAMSKFLQATDDGNSLTYSLAGGGTSGLSEGRKGNVTINSATGQYTYTPCTAPDTASSCVPAAPSAGFRGMDRFTFRVTDQFGQTSDAVVNILIDDADVVATGPGRVRIMPLGDSITAGDGSGSGLDSERTGYRRPLYLDLSAAGAGRYEVNFVGSLIAGQDAGPPAFDTDNEGHGGWCSTTPCSTYGGIAQNVFAWLDTNPADIVLLHIGTNDLNSGRTPDDTVAGVAAILNEIDRWEAANYPVTVFLARIIKDVPGLTPDLAVATLNDKLQIMANGRTSDRVFMVNMQTGAGLDYGPGDGSLGADMHDNLHPNESGYVKMANTWKAELTAPANIGPKYMGLPACQ
jgi:lysophospholipase L1-like esterase